MARISQYTSHRLLALIVCCLLPLALTGCGVPRDPEGTLNKVRDGKLRVGVLDRPPWASYQDKSTPPTGADVELVKNLAGQLDAEIEWHRGSEADLMEGLKTFQLDLVVGGLTKGSAWKKEFGPTRSYFKSHDIVAVPPGVARPVKLGEQKVAVRRESPLVPRLKSKGTQPIEMDEKKLRKAKMPVAGADWQLIGWGYTPTKFKLTKHVHLWAAPPGENGWIYRLDQFLYDNRQDVRALLKKHMDHRASAPGAGKAPSVDTARQANPKSKPPAKGGG